MQLYRNALLDNLDRFGRERAGSIAVAETFGRSVTFGELAGQVDAVASNLVEAGFAKGERALLLVRPGVDAIVCILAIMRAGGIVVAADIAMGQEAFASRVGLAAPTWVFAESLFLAVQRLPIARRLLRARGVEIPESTSLAGANVVRVGPPIPGLSTRLTLSGLRRSRPRPRPDAWLDPASDAAIIFTSGTTALPKGVVHTQASLEAMLRMVVDLVAADDSDVFYGTVLQVIAPALFRGCTLVMPRAPTAATTVADLRRYGVTLWSGPPAELEPTVRYCTEQHLTLPSSLRAIVLGSAPVHAPFLLRLAGVTASATAVTAVYGLTEILPVAKITQQEKIAWHGEGDPIGRPLPGVTVRVAGDGELLAAGPNLFHRYLDGPPLTEASTGDLARIEADGTIVLRGRKKDMIIRGIYNVYPGMVEPTILRIPGVRDCCLVGVYDHEAADEKIVLVVEKADERPDRDFRAFLEKHLLSGPFSIDQYAMPDEILFATIPRSGRSSKVDRAALARYVQQRLQRTGAPA